MVTPSKPSMPQLSLELRLRIWGFAFGHPSQIQTLSVFDTKLYELDTKIPEDFSKSENLVPIDSHWSIVSVPKRCLPSALLTCRETWDMRGAYGFVRQNGHRLINPASVDVLRRDPERFYQKTVYSPIPKTVGVKMKKGIAHPGELVHFKPFERCIKTSPSHTTEIASLSRPMRFRGIRYLAISFTDLYYFMHGGPNIIKFPRLKILFVLKPTFNERGDNPCTRAEFEIGLGYMKEWKLKSPDIFPIWDEPPVKFIRVDNLEDAMKEAERVEKKRLRDGRESLRKMKDDRNFWQAAVVGSTLPKVIRWESWDRKMGVQSLSYMP